MTDDGPTRRELEDQVDDLEEKVLGDVARQDRHDAEAGQDERSDAPAIEQDIDDEELAGGGATSEPTD